MHWIKTLATLTALSVCASSAFATNSGAGQSLREGAPKGITEAFYACADKAGSDMLALGSCTSSEKKVQDARLNKAYAILMTKLEPKAKESVKAAERSWLDFNGKSVNAELDLRAADKTASIEASISEVFRYCDQANVLENFVYFVND
jgi:uncharacterized protein YecT (DUF1311 family)